MKNAEGMEIVGIRGRKYQRRCPDCMFWSEEEEGWEREKCPRCGYDWLRFSKHSDVEYYTWFTYALSHIFGNCYERKN